MVEPGVRHPPAGHHPGQPPRQPGHVRRRGHPVVGTPEECRGEVGPAQVVLGGPSQAGVGPGVGLWAAVVVGLEPARLVDLRVVEQSPDGGARRRVAQDARQQSLTERERERQ